MYTCILTIVSTPDTIFGGYYNLRLKVNSTKKLMVLFPDRNNRSNRSAYVMVETMLLLLHHMKEHLYIFDVSLMSRSESPITQNLPSPSSPRAAKWNYHLSWRICARWQGKTISHAMGPFQA